MRGALKRRLQAVIEPRGRHGNLSGVLIKLGSGFTVLGPIATGLDDWTYLEFVKAKFPARESSLIPGLDIGDGGRFEARARFVTGVGRSAWLEWRADRLGAIYAELAAVVTEAAPGGCLVLVTPTPEDGVAAEEARQSDQRGEPPDAAWLALGLDLKRWPADVPGLAVLRGVSLGGDELAQELATSPELDQAIHAQSVRGAWVGGERRTDFGDAPGGSRLDARPARIDVPLGHAMAVLDPSWVVVDASVVAGSEGLLTRFCRVFHALPPARSAPAPPLPSGVALRSYEGADGTYVSIANDSPYEVLQAALLSAPAGTTVDDVGRHVRFEPTPVQDGGQSLVLRLPPFGVTTLRIGASLVVVQPGTSYLPALAALESQADGLSARLVNSEALIGPPSPGFEPQRPRPHAAGPGMMQVGAPDAALAFDGWHAGDIALGEVQADASNPHSGSRALRLAAAGPSASAACDEFLPPGGTSLSIQTWLRSDRPDCRVRVHIEGQSRGVSIARHADVPAGPEWSERIVRVPELPAEGLDWMRLRYEWLEAEPGKLWIDDVAVNGQGASESGKRAHRVLLEALQAYRARRFAEFARLMGSRRARHAVPNLGVIEPSTIRTGQASDLPANRRLR